ncbi:hypothetical protein [Nocardia otitidiscaviarum]|nr:hypothetical protein [Nocardia otitidiscaviarum]
MRQFRDVDPDLAQGQPSCSVVVETPPVRQSAVVDAGEIALDRIGVLPQ